MTKTEAIQAGADSGKKASVTGWGVLGFLFPIIAIPVAYIRSPAVPTLVLVSHEDKETAPYFEAQFIETLKKHQVAAAWIGGLVSFGIMVALWVFILVVATIGAASASGAEESPAQVSDPEGEELLANDAQEEKSPAKPAGKKPTLILVDARDLLSEYRSNSIRANEKYGRKALRVAGVTKKVTKDFLGSPYLLFDTGDLSELEGVQAYFSRRDDGLMSVTPGSYAEVICKSVSDAPVMGGAVLKGCELR